NSHRIAFALRGLSNTYNTYEDGIKKMIIEINVRHDNSGRYPQSALDYRLEREVVDECRKPLDNFLDFASQWKVDDKRDVESEWSTCRCLLLNVVYFPMHSCGYSE